MLSFPSNHQEHCCRFQKGVEGVIPAGGHVVDVVLGEEGMPGDRNSTQPKLKEEEDDLWGFGVQVKYASKEVTV